MTDTPVSASAPKSRLQAALQAGQFAVTAEIGPPRGANVNPIRRKARLLRDWIDAANITDNQSAVVRLASWAGCLVVMQEGVEPVMQLQCRDRNRIVLQSDLLGAAAMGIPNVLLLTGDHTRFGDHPDAKPVFDLDSIQLVWTARTMQQQAKLLSGRELKPAPEWFIGAVENPFAPPLKWRAQRLGKKVAAGARFCQTQFIYDVNIFRQWMQHVRDLGLDKRCSILAGVGPIRSLRAMEFMRQEVPGMYVPDEVVRRLRGVPGDQVSAEGLKLCSEIIAEVKEIPGVAGVHVMAVSWEDAVPEILERAGLARKPSETTAQAETAAPVAGGD
ncbi:MAG: methylenetetrahydrofolate reductase [Chloroflexi bacterium]|nr:methylenetetrahydrofolate reductase [Chloroflexota bacterium]MBV9597738.1 methylenetetrahydrofolate reductase [Chloroflexota bacterium]